MLTAVVKLMKTPIFHLSSQAGGRGICSIARVFAILLASHALCLADAGTFYTQRGTDKTFEEIMKGGELKTGSNTTTGLLGSRISVNSSLLKDGPNARRKIPDDILIHTLAHSAIPRRDFAKWSRWYQEDGNTQVFRLFKGEKNVRNDRDLAARIEAFGRESWTEGAWHEWVGTYTIIKPHGAAIFQAKNNENDWSVQLNMSSAGDVTLNHRRGEDKVIARNMTGKPFHIRVRDNGLDYEVFINGKNVGKGSYARPKGVTNFRWGMYLGGKEVTHDAMIFVTGAEIDPKNVDESGLSAPDESPSAKTKEKPPEPEKPETPEGLAIPARKWTNKDGVIVSAPGIAFVTSPPSHS